MSDSTVPSTTVPSDSPLSPHPQKSSFSLTNHSFSLAFFYNVALFFLLVILGKPVFQTNDDYGLYVIVSGVLGTAHPHLPFGQEWLGHLLLPLFRLFPTINWVSIYEYFIMFLGFTTISKVFFSFPEKKYFQAAGFVVPGLIAPFFYSILQFTRAATIP
ncbi:MAG: hypothetical protein GX786_06495, partial [Clostridiales bacterium]|nr:hypothetical protein [Clostridiales bacterium]